MGTMIPTMFTRYEFDKAEEIQARLLSPLQVQMFHNIMTEIAEARVQMKFNPAEVNSYIQNESYSSGKLDLLRELLQANEQAISDLESYRQTLNQTNQTEVVTQSTNLFDIFKSPTNNDEA